MFLLTFFSFSPNDYLEESQNFLSKLSLEEYGPCVTVPVTDEAELQLVSDNYSVAAVKVLCDM